MSWLEPMVAGTGVLLADQLSKRHVLAQPRFCGAQARRSFVSIRCVINRRAAAMSLSAPWMVIGVWMLCVAFALLALLQEPLARSLTGAAGIGMVVGGITGNFIDVLRRGGIVDFISIGPWPVFNVADAAIVGGLGLTLLAMR